MIKDSQNHLLWDTAFSALCGKTPRQILTTEGNREFSFDHYVKGAFGEKLLSNMLPWLNFGSDNMNSELLAYWKEQGVVKECHRNDREPGRTWFAYLPEDYEHLNRKLPVWYVNHAEGRDILDIESWGFVQLVAEKKIMVLTTENGNSEEIFLDTLNAALAEYPADPERVYLVGHSLSGSCAGRIAVSLPEKISGLCMLGSQYSGLDSSEEELEWLRKLRMPRVDVHGTAERVLPYHLKDKRPASPPRFNRVTPTDFGLQASYQEQMLWRGVNRCRCFTIDEMEQTGNASENKVEREIGIPLDRTLIRELGSVKHYIGDVVDDSGSAMMRFIGVEGGPHYPSAYGAELAYEFLHVFSRNTKDHKLVIQEDNNDISRTESVGYTNDGTAG